MRKTSTLLLFTVILSSYFGQTHNPKNDNLKGKFFIYWGWNRSAYTTSDIHFTGKEYDFTLHDVVATDRQSPFKLSTYFHPTSITIPQYNLRLGYFFHNNYQISFGADHMKYVMRANQMAKISGHIANSSTPFDGTYDNDDILLSPNFLKFEHTDGLNYENIEVRRFDALIRKRRFTLYANEGLGLGILLPRTNATLLNNPRNDQFHLAGYGISAVASLNFTFFDFLFIQTECKGGFIHMPDILTTPFKEDRASQHFFFGQYNVVFGANFPIKRKKHTFTDTNTK
jgi:hypothetical protein